MNPLIKMAWRNIWRNKKRTILTMSSIIIAVLLSLLSRSIQKGMFGNMVTNAVKLSTGYIQIHKTGYWENKSINETFEQKEIINSILEKHENISLVIPRLESFALTSSGNMTKGAMVIGTNTVIENKLNNYSDKIIKGEFLKPDDRSILIGDKLAKYLEVDVGDSLVLLGQGYHGVTAAEQYLIKGILHLPIPELNKQLIMMSLKESQYYYASANRLTSLSLMLNDPESLNSTTDYIKNKLGDKYEVMTWYEMNKEILQFVDSKNVGSIIMLSVLYIVIGFGVFGTIMMMAMERRKEFAIMVSVGMQKTKLLFVVVMETIFIGLVAIIIGIFIVYPILYYYSHNPILFTGEYANTMETFGIEPIIPFSISPIIFINQTIAVITIATIAVIYPLVYILKFNVLKAMRN